MLPGFLLVGGQRCGTTSLFEALAQHPSVRRPQGRKGIHYFDVSYHRGMAWYRGHFPLAIRSAPKAITGESSPYYLFHPLAAERIARDLPEVKLVVALRDPVERAYSAHAHEFARDYETEPFERAIEMEAERLRGEAQRLSSDPSRAVVTPTDITPTWPAAVISSSSNAWRRWSAVRASTWWTAATSSPRRSPCSAGCSTSSAWTDQHR